VVSTPGTMIDPKVIRFQHTTQLSRIYNVSYSHSSSSNNSLCINAKGEPSETIDKTGAECWLCESEEQSATECLGEHY
jgi:hypothetical protein